jgi:predicted alpha/beta hydrolase
MIIENIENGIEFPPFTVPVTRYLSNQQRVVAIVVPAMGTTASFYQPFAEELATRGISVLSPELPGTGASHPRPSWKVDYGYRDLIKSYLPGVVQSAKVMGQGAPVVLIGHSLGAHAAALAVMSGSIEVDALVIIAGGNTHYRNWDGAGAGKVWFAAVLFSSLTRLFGQMPGQYFGFGGPQARTLIREWSKIIRTGRFSHITDISDKAGAVPTLAIGIEGDTFAPEKSVDMLAGMLGGETKILPKTWKGNPHSSWARNPVVMASQIVDWLGDLETPGD